MTFIMNQSEKSKIVFIYHVTDHQMRALQDMFSLTLGSSGTPLVIRYIPSTSGKQIQKSVLNT